MKKKIAIFQSDLSVGGIQRSLINFLKVLDYTKYDVDLYLFENNANTNELPKQVKVIYLRPKCKLYKFIPFSIYKLLYKYNIDKEYEISIDYNGYNNNTALAMINSKSKKNLMWIHSDLKERKRKNLKFRYLYFISHKKYKYVDEFICVSDVAKESFEQLNRFKINCITIPNIVFSKDIIDKSNETIKFNLKIDDSKINLVSVGRLDYSKGFDILLNYMKFVIEKRKDINLFIIGSGPQEKNIRKQILKLNLENNVFLLGNQKNPFNIMKLMDAFILTSRYEGQGIAIIEAKVLGLPIIISKNLEKYVKNLDIIGSDNIINDIIDLKKVSKRNVNSLNEYNDSIKESINKILNGR